ncbi:MAG: SPFH domain-containing protein [Planctomycetota bacterium]|jgi:regulator of protease activity HflC (stomatin/prohibitin superfamily)
MSPLKIVGCVAGAFAALVCLLLAFWCWQTIPAGHGGVATLFGNVIEKTYDDGLHFPVNPLLSWTEYDCRDKNFDVTGVQVPTKDQQTSTMDFSVQYRLNKSALASIKQDIGKSDDVVAVKLTPNIRSLVRSEGKAVSRCEELFNDTVQATMETNLQANLQTRVGDYAIIDAVLVRKVKLPGHIEEAIKNKKVREQRAEEQKAELERFKTEQEQLIASAEAQRRAAEEAAKQKMLLADADAYEVTKVGEALAKSPGYIQLEALAALKEISKDPASKLYFLDGNSPTPLPLMHLGDAVTGALK